MEKSSLNQKLVNKSTHMPDRQELQISSPWQNLAAILFCLASKRAFAQNRNLMTLNKACFLPFSRSPSVFLSSLQRAQITHLLLLLSLWIWAYDLQHSANTFLKGEKTPPQARVAVPGRRTGPAMMIIHSSYSLHNLPLQTTPESVYASSPLNFSSIQLSRVLTLGFLQARPKFHYETCLSSRASHLS